MANILLDYQKKVLEALSNRIDDFYLAGGTALSLYYFHHRESLDLDFFTKNFDRSRIEGIIETLEGALSKKSELLSEQASKEKVRIAVYLLLLSRSQRLKIDFVEDYVELIIRPKKINGIKVLSLEDIFLRKIFAASGTRQVIDETGRPAAKGGRHEAKDFYDLYCLSTVFIPLSDFSFKYGSPQIREALIRWFRSYDRMDMKSGVLSLKLTKKVDYKDMERHFKKEIDKIIAREVGLL
jgi:predicted nucleotidyltransferase component of viral defense system